MFFLIYLGVLAIAYVVTFKDDFDKEHIEKASPFIFIVSALFILIGLLGSISSK